MPREAGQRVELALEDPFPYLMALFSLMCYDSLVAKVKLNSPTQWLLAPLRIRSVALKPPYQCFDWTHCLPSYICSINIH